MGVSHVMPSVTARLTARYICSLAHGNRAWAANVCPRRCRVAVVKLASNHYAGAHP